MRGLKDLSSGPLGKLFTPSHVTDKEEGRSEDNDSNSKFDLGVPDDLVVSVVLLRNWLFALEGTEEARDWSSPRSGDPIGRDDKCVEERRTHPGRRLRVNIGQGATPGIAYKVVQITWRLGEKEI